MMVLLIRHGSSVPPNHARLPRSPSDSFKIVGPPPVTFSPTLRLRKSFSCNTYGLPRKCCKQKTYGRAKPFRCNTYKKPGGHLLQAKSISLFCRLSPPLLTPLFPLLQRFNVQTFRRANSLPYPLTSLPRLRETFRCAVCIPDTFLGRSDVSTFRHASVPCS